MSHTPAPSTLFLNWVVFLTALGTHQRLTAPRAWILLYVVQFLSSLNRSAVWTALYRVNTVSLATVWLSLAFQRLSLSTVGLLLSSSLLLNIYRTEALNHASFVFWVNACRLHVLLCLWVL